MTFWKWSRTASANANADASVNWAEGQPSSSVNDSGRAMMAAAAKYRDDISGAIVTSGSPTAFTLSSYQQFDSLAHMDGAMIAFTPHATNTGSATLNVDGLGAKPLRITPGQDILAGTVILGTPYAATYFNSAGEWVLHGISGNIYNVPLAAGMDYWGPTTPNSSFAFPAGQAISRTTYASLFALIGTTYGSGDGTTTFNLPDKTERVSVMKAAAASRLTPTYFGGDSTQLGATGGAENVSMALANLIQHDHTVFLNDPGHSHTTNAAIPVGTGSNNPGGISPSSSGATIFSATTGITIWSDGAGTGTQNKVGKTGSATPTPMRTVQPTIVCNYIMRVI